MKHILSLFYFKLPEVVVVYVSVKAVGGGDTDRSISAAAADEICVWNISPQTKKPMREILAILTLYLTFALTVTEHNKWPKMSL